MRKLVKDMSPQEYAKERARWLAYRANNREKLAAKARARRAQPWYNKYHAEYVAKRRAAQEPITTVIIET